MARVGIVSYRLGGADGVAIEAEKWADAFEHLGFEVTRVAGEGTGDVEIVAGLGIGDSGPVDRAHLERVLAPVDLVVVENLCSLPLNPAARDAVADVRRGRPTIMRHHDLAWQRGDTAHLSLPADDAAWRHVTINELSVQQLAERGYTATCLYNRFAMDPPTGDRVDTRQSLGLREDQRLLLQPTRALPRKNVPGGIALAQALDATYWLTAAAEDGYGPILDAIIAASDVPILRGPGPGSIHDAYAAADVVVLPSTWEGFGNPAIEAVTHRRPLCLNRYPVALEILATGIEAFDPAGPDELRAWLSDPDTGLLDRNLAVARQHFDVKDLPDDIARILATF